MRELQRRRENKAITIARRALEEQRQKRLKQLQPALTVIRKLSHDKSTAIATELRSHVEDLPSIPPPVEDGVEEYVEQVLPAEESDEDSEQVPEDEVETAKQSQQELDQKLLKKIARKVLRTYTRYKESLPTFADLQVPSTLPPASSPILTSAEQLETDPNFHVSASRHQYQLAMREGETWALLSTGVTKDFKQAEGGFLDLYEQSRVLVESYRRRTDFPNDQTYEDARTLLTAMGVPCVQSEAPYEGEGLAAAIALAGHADFVVSEDTDVILYGAPILRGMTDKKMPLREIIADEVEEALQLSHKSFLDFALLLGTDFTRRIPLVGPVRALKFIKSHGSIEEIVRVETKYPPSFALHDYLGQVAIARHIFESLPPVPDPEALRQNPIDEGYLQTVLKNYGLSKAMLSEEEDFFTVAFPGNVFGDNPHVT